MTLAAVADVVVDSAGVSRSSSQMSGSSESLNRENSSDSDSSMTIPTGGGGVLKEISNKSGGNGSKVFKLQGGPKAMGTKVLAAPAAGNRSKKMSAPPKVLEEQTRLARQQHNSKNVSNGGGNGLKLKIPAILEESSSTDEPSTAGTTASEDSVQLDPELMEYVGNRTEILPWNIVADPPLTNRNELYPIEGSWRLISQQNYDKYLSAIGVTPLMAQMVLRSDFMITIYEDIDKCWKILTETSIKAKSIKGYKCRNYKMTSNKFMLEEEKPELLDDWDPRLVVTTLTFDEETKTSLVFDQQADKDLKFRTSSRISAQAEISKDGDSSRDTLTLTCETANGIKAVRKLIRHIKPSQDPFAFKTSRKVSAPF